MTALEWTITKQSNPAPAGGFAADESGAMTVDWVVLSATMVILGAVIIGMYREGVYNAANAINESIVNQAPDPDAAPWWGTVDGPVN